MRYIFATACLAVAALEPISAAAADRHTCRVIETLMQTIDRGLAEAAAGTGDRQPASGIATYARQAQEFAAQFSTRDPLPEVVVTALSDMADAAASMFSVAEAAPALLEPALVVQQAMPQVCAASEVPDLSRHRM